MKRRLRQVTESASARLRKACALHDHLTREIRGQPEVVERLAWAVACRELETIPTQGARGAFFFAGPTGVGKTETALQLGFVISGPNSLVRFDCSEFKTLEGVAGVLGDRAGDRGRFGQAYSQVPRGVWLFDEIEKGHADFVHLFLQMVSAGRVTLANGETLDLSRIYIVVTSNLGSTEILGREHLPFTSLEGRVIKRIQGHIRPELLGRFGAPFVFRPLTREVQAEIAHLHFTKLMEWQLTKGRHIIYDGAVIEFLVQRGFSPRLGARPLLDTIYEQVGNAIVENLLAGGKGCGRFHIDGDRLRLIP